MSLSRCKECGNVVSSKAKQCPKCGGPVKVKTSIWVWLLTGFVVLWVMGQLGDESGGSSSNPDFS